MCAALQNLPGLRQAMDWMDEHHRSARTPQPWHSLEPRSGGGRQAEQEPTAAEAFLAPALTQLHARTKSLLAEMMAERSLSMSELSEPEVGSRLISKLKCCHATFLLPRLLMSYP